jgi:xanthine phosphoribosyltransferase
MQSLVERILAEGQHLGGGILKVDSFLNHQLDPALTLSMGEHFVARLAELGIGSISKVITAEVSGIAPAFCTAMLLACPMIYARKTKPITMPERVYAAKAQSRTKGNVNELSISPEYLSADDRVVIVDDFLATGSTLWALVEIVRQSGAELLAIACVIEKPFEKGREKLAPLAIPIISLARVLSMTEQGIEVEAG